MSSVEADGQGSVTEVVLQRVVFPWDIELPAPMAEILPLYVTPRGVLRQIHDGVQGPEQAKAATGADGYVVTGRRSLQLEPFSRASFDSYFNRVHAGYYARWTVAEALTLRLEGSGRTRVTVRHSTREGRQVVDQVAIVDLSDRPFTSTIKTSTFLGGGAVWFELESLDEPVVLDSAEWVAEVPDFREPVLDIAICTFNRPQDVLKALRTLKSDHDFLAHLGTIWIADNGTQSFLDLEGGAELAASWGHQLVVINQPNLGGSGGFSRGMYESANRGEADYVFLMDDDALAEPESLRRALVFAEIASVPIAVGGQMLVRGKPLVLHSSGERIDGKDFSWGKAPLGADDVRVDVEPLDTVVDVGYNGWWLCLLPIEAIREVGLSQPYFIKWDDAEYGYRLAEHGFMTVTLPGVAVWHESWEMKDDATDWTLFFHVRNRLITAAFLSRDLPEKAVRARFSAVTRNLILFDVMKNLSRRAFSSVSAANDGLEAFLAGPDQLADRLDEKVAEVRAARSRFPGDEVVVPFSATTRAPIDPTEARGIRRPTGLLRALGRELGLKVPLIPVPIPPSLLERPRSDEWEIWREPVDRGPAVVPKAGDHWWGVTDHADAYVVSVDGSKAFHRPRDVRAARELLRTSIDLARRVNREAPGLVAAYAEARDRYVKPEAWEKQWNR